MTKNDKITLAFLDILTKKLDNAEKTLPAESEAVARMDSVIMDISHFSDALKHGELSESHLDLYKKVQKITKMV